MSFTFDCDALYIETHSLHQEGKYHGVAAHLPPWGQPFAARGASAARADAARQPALGALAIARVLQDWVVCGRHDAERVRGSRERGPDRQKRQRAASVAAASARDAARAGSHPLGRSCCVCGGAGAGDQPGGRHQYVTLDGWNRDTMFIDNRKRCVSATEWLLVMWSGPSCESWARMCT
ncbi:hypothetical protein BC834DRAFT_400420 [Gloeopeniophorella convolvens]|nr:hypothetical protein BC834DRAFT_400420 [Gloeopeniophorella convolvens]